MSDIRPEPFVTAGTDIDGYRKALIDWDKLFGSDLYLEATLEELGAAFVLWGKSYRQSPPGSLPNDDQKLAKMLGISDRWKKIKHVALRGFVECSDGRLYHKVIAEDVMKAAASKSANSNRAQTARAAKAAKRKGTNGYHAPITNGADEDEDFPL